MLSIYQSEAHCTRSMLHKSLSVLSLPFNFTNEGGFGGVFVFLGLVLPFQLLNSGDRPVLSSRCLKISGYLAVFDSNAFIIAVQTVLPIFQARSVYFSLVDLVNLVGVSKDSFSFQIEVLQFSASQSFCLSISSLAYNCFWILWQLISRLHIFYWYSFSDSLNLISSLMTVSVSTLAASIQFFKSMFSSSRHSTILSSLLYQVLFFPICALSFSFDFISCFPGRVVFSEMFPPNIFMWSGSSSLSLWLMCTNLLYKSSNLQSGESSKILRKQILYFSSRFSISVSLKEKLACLSSYLLHLASLYMLYSSSLCMLTTNSLSSGPLYLVLISAMMAAMVDLYSSGSRIETSVSSVSRQYLVERSFLLIIYQGNALPIIIYMRWWHQ